MSTPVRFLLPESLYREIIEQARAENPHECCGLLAAAAPSGPVCRIAKCYPLANALGSPVEYESDPASMFRAIKDMRGQGLEIVGVYHSHPTAPPVPSRKDCERNYSEEVVNFIVSLLFDPPVMCGWWLTAEDYREAEWALAGE